MYLYIVAEVTTYSIGKAQSLKSMLKREPKAVRYFITNDLPKATVDSILKVVEASSELSYKRDELKIAVDLISHQLRAHGVEDTLKDALVNVPKSKQDDPLLNWMANKLYAENDPKSYCCPYCKEVVAIKAFKAHLHDAHNATHEDMVGRYCFNDKWPVCANPYCKKPMGLKSPKHLNKGMRQYCDDQCASGKRKLKLVSSKKLSPLDEAIRYIVNVGLSELWNKPNANALHAKMSIKASLINTPTVAIDLVQYDNHFIFNIRDSEIFFKKYKSVWTVENIGIHTAVSIEGYLRSHYKHYRGATKYKSEKETTYSIMQYDMIRAKIEELLEANYTDPNIVISSFKDE